MRQRKPDPEPSCGCAGVFTGPWAPEVQALQDRAAAEHWRSILNDVLPAAPLTLSQRLARQQEAHLAQVADEERSAYQL